MTKQKSRMLYMMHTDECTLQRPITYFKMFRISLIVIDQPPNEISAKNYNCEILISPEEIM